MARIKGFTFDTDMDWVQNSIKFIKEKMGRKLTEEELAEVAALWNWNYGDDECVDMLKEGKTATEYDKDFQECL